MLKDFGLTDVRYIASGLACGTTPQELSMERKEKTALSSEVCGTVAIEHKYYAPQWAQLFPKAEAPI